MKKYVWILLALPALFGFGCAGSQSESATEVSYDAGAPATQGVPRGTEMTTASMAAQRHVIRNGSISLRVEDVRKSANSITEMVVKGGGYVESSTSAGVGTGNPTVDLTIRVVSSGFDDAMIQLEGMGTLLDQNTESEDVTAQIVDLGARIKTLAAKEETFREMIRVSRNVNDVVALQDRLTEVRTEIERMDAQRKSLSELASLSTIKVHLTQTATVPTASQDPNWFTNALGGATTSFMGTFQKVVAALTWAVVYSPFWLLPLIGAWWLIKRQVRRTPPMMAE
ncbi:MAG: DUF4349 domain-containing protein [Fimbriimonadaceae bacterium]